MALEESIKTQGEMPLSFTFSVVAFQIPKPHVTPDGSECVHVGGLLARHHSTTLHNFADIFHLCALASNMTTPELVADLSGSIGEQYASLLAQWVAGSETE
jgi:hypothetical protein